MAAAPCSDKPLLLLLLLRRRSPTSADALLLLALWWRRPAANDDEEEGHGGGEVTEAGIVPICAAFCNSAVADMCAADGTGTDAEIPDEKLYGCG